MSARAAIGGPTATNVPTLRKRSRDGKLVAEVGDRAVPLTNLDKLMYPAAGFTKGQVIDYYARMAPVVLPHVRGRPLTLKRFPDGVGGAYFYEKNCQAHLPPWVTTVPIWTERAQEHFHYCAITEEATIIWLANLADLELHPALATAEWLERPSWVILGRDPGAPAGLLEACEVALLLHGLFDRLGLRSFVKSSGGKGLHLLVPLNGQATYDGVRPFARQVAETLEARFPDQVVSTQTRAKRPGRVLIDWGQNSRHKTTVSAYSLRARDRPTVSMPLEWAELERANDERTPERLVFEPDEALARVKERGDLLAPVLTLNQELPSI